MLDFFAVRNSTGMVLTATGRQTVEGALAWLRAERGAVSCTLSVLMWDAIHVECTLHADGRLVCSPAAHAAHDAAVAAIIARAAS